jgi:hypothetical protein
MPTGFTTAFSRENFDKGIRSIVYPKAPVGLMFNGDPASRPMAEQHQQPAKFAPRAGIVWDPRGEQQLQTIRVAYRSLLRSPKLWQYAHHMLNPRSARRQRHRADHVRTNRNGCAINFADPWSTTPGGDPLGDQLSAPGRAGDAAGGERDVPGAGRLRQHADPVTPMQVTQWNLSYQRQFLGNMMFDVTYMGNSTTHIWCGYEENPSIYIPATASPGSTA